MISVTSKLGGMFPACASSSLLTRPPHAASANAKSASAAHVTIRLPERFRMSVRSRAFSKKDRKVTTAVRPGHARVAAGSGVRQGHAALAHVLAAAVLVARLALLVRLEEQHLRDALVRVDLRRQRRRVRELERDVAFPLGLER